MNRLKFIAITCFCLCALSISTQAQEKMKLKLQYNAAQPLGSLKSYINNTSINGWGAELDYKINETWHAGLALGYQDFYQKIPRQLYTSGEQTTSAVQTRSMQVIPVLLQGVYYAGEAGKVRPYAKLGIGGAFVRNDKFWGQFNERDNGFGFAASPGVGISIPIGRYKSSALQFGIQYNYVTYRYEEVDNLSSVQANVGIAFPLR